MSLFWFLIIGMGLIGMGYGPLASFLPELFPTHARYSGASLTYNIAGLFGASVAAIITFATECQLRSKRRWNLSNLKCRIKFDWTLVYYGNKR